MAVPVVCSQNLSLLETSGRNTGDTGEEEVLDLVQCKDASILKGGVIM